MTVATVNGVELYYEAHGDSGEPLLLVHGYTGDITDWRRQIPVFSATHRVLIMDLRGHGRSEVLTDRSLYTVDLMTADVEALIDHVGFDRYHLVGHSMGGTIAQEIALRNPDTLLSLTLHSTAPSFNSDADPAIAAWRDYRFQLAETKGMAALAAADPIMPPPPHMPPERGEETDKRLAQMSVDAFVGAGIGLTSWRGTVDRAHAIKTPTLIIYGDLDSPPVQKGSAKLGELIQESIVEIIPETGHQPQWERPDLFNAALGEFLAQHATVPQTN